MTKIELAIKALEELPPEQREEVAEMVLELTSAFGATSASALTDEQWAEVQRRRERGFRPGDPERVNQLLARLK